MDIYEKNLHHAKKVQKQAMTRDIKFKNYVSNNNIIFKEQLKQNLTAI